MSSEFIISCIQQYWPDIPITEHLLEHPTSEFVLMFYQQFQETIKDRLNSIKNIDPTAAIDEPKPNDDSIMSILCFVNTYLRRGQCNQLDADGRSLTLTDLYEPTAKRTQVRFKMLLNLLLFYDEKISTAVKDVVTEHWFKVETFKAKNEEKEALREKLAVEAENLASTEDKLCKLRKEEDRAGLRYKTMEKQKSENDIQHAKLNQEMQELVSTYGNKQALITSVETNIQRLNEQVVTEDSYKALLDLKEDLFKKCTTLENEIEGLGENLVNRGPEIERFNTINEEFIRVISTCKELLTIQKSFTLLNTELQTSKGTYKQSIDELKTRKENALKCKKSIAMLKEALQSSAVKFTTLKKQKTEQLEQLKEAIGNEQQLQNDIMQEKDLQQEEIEQLENDIEQIRLKIRELCLLYEETYKNILNSSRDTTNLFSSMLEQVTEAIHYEDGNF